MARKDKVTIEGRRSLPYYPTDPSNGKLSPSSAIVREIDFEQRGGELWFFFSRWSKDVKLSEYDNKIDKLVNEIVEGGFRRWEPDPPVLDIPYSTPLSLKNDKLKYVIYVLSNKSWQFTRVGYPITIGPKPSSRGIYFDAFRIFESYADRDLGGPFDDPAAKPRDNCKMTCFISDGKTAKGSKNEYDHPINLHVDLVFRAVKPRYMQIMIDPDVRFPGGAGQ